jgi:hypothetical protein
MAQSAAAQPTQPAQVQVQVQAEPASTDAGEGALGAGNPLPTQAEPAQPVPPKRPAHYLWAVLMARIYEVFPLVCPICGGQMRIIAFITYSADIRHILEHIGVDAEPPRITPARGPPLWDGCEAQIGEGVDVASDWDDVAQVAPDFEADQRVSWLGKATAVWPTLRGRAAPGNAEKGGMSDSLGLRALIDGSKRPGSVAW